MRILPATRRLARRVAVALSLGVALTRSVVAQSSPQPLVLQHGFNSDGSSWVLAANAFRAQLNVTTHAYTTSWTQVFETQAAGLLGAMQSDGLPDTTIGIGHSNGGLVMRYASEGHALKGILTIGTLHRGAPLAANLFDVGLIGFVMQTDAFRAIEDYGPLTHDFFTGLALLFAGALGALGTLQLDGAAAFAFATPELLHEMGPGSEFLDGLNSAANLTREAEQIPFRVGITSQVGSYAGIMWQGLRPDEAADLTDVQYALEAYFWGTYLYFEFYNNENDPDEFFKQAYALDWALAASDLSVIDPLWCVLIGAPNAGSCVMSDGIVPADRQAYPGATLNIPLLNGPAHQQEKESPQFHNLAIGILRDIFLVQPVGVGPPVFTASIVGPRLVAEYTGNVWTAAAANGVPPYTYQWLVDGVDFGTADSIPAGSDWYGGSSHTITLTVTDGENHVATTSLTVYVTLGP